MTNPSIAIAAMLALLAGSMGALSAGARRVGVSPEAARKLLHVEMGIATAAFPWIFGATWPVVLLAGMSVAWFGALRASIWLAMRFGVVLEATRRTSLGEIWFVIGACLAFLLEAGDAPAYCIAMLVLAFADAAAALAGKRWGRPRRVLGGAQKSVLGSTVFCIVAFAVAALVLAIATEHEPGGLLLTSLFVALVTTLIEGLLARGLDNLFVPLSALAALHLASASGTGALFGLICLAASLIVLIFWAGSIVDR